MYGAILTVIMYRYNVQLVMYTYSKLTFIVAHQLKNKVYFITSHDMVKNVSTATFLLFKDYILKKQ